MTQVRGLLWYADKQPLLASLDQAIRRYQERFHRLPDVLYINLENPDILVCDFQVVKVRWIMKGHCLLSGEATR